MPVEQDGEISPLKNLRALDNPLWAPEGGSDMVPCHVFLSFKVRRLVFALLVKGGRGAMAFSDWWIYLLPAALTE